MPPKRTACPFHQRGGCRKGEQCNMLHIGPPGIGAPHGQTNSNRPANNTSNTGNANPAGMPPNACRAFWTDGECENSFSCRFRHVKAGASFLEQDPSPPPQAPLSNDDVAYASNPYTGALPGAGLTPTQAHNRIKLYLKPDYDFRSSEDYYSFVSILQSANAENHTWVCLSMSLFGVWRVN